MNGIGLSIAIIHLKARSFARENSELVIGLLGKSPGPTDL